MSVIEKLSSAKGKRSKSDNKALAGEIAANSDRKSIKELIFLLDDKNKTIQSDAIEVLYETGYLKPDLTARYQETFVQLLSHKNNRLVWGAMIALSTISKISPKTLFPALDAVRQAVDSGSVITKDAGVAVYANLATVKAHKDKVLPLLFKELKKCPDKQLAQYAEKAAIAIDKDAETTFLGLLNSRMKNLGKASQISRVKRVLKQFEQK